MKLDTTNTNSILVDIYLGATTILRGCFMQAPNESNDALLNILNTLQAIDICLAGRPEGDGRVLALSGDFRELRIRVADITALAYYLNWELDGYPIYRTVTLATPTATHLADAAWTR